MARRRSFEASLVLILALAGCGGGSNETTETAARSPTTTSRAATTLRTPITATVPATTTTIRGRVEVTAVGVSTGTQFSRNVATAAAVIKNPTSQVATDIRVNINLKDASGAIVKTETASIAVLAPGAEAYAAPSFYLEQSLPVPASAEAQVLAREFVPGPIGGFTFKDIRYTSDQYSGKILGTIVSGITRTVTQVQIQCATFLGGKVNGGGFTFVDLVPAGESTGFQVVNGTIPGMSVDEVRCSGNPSGLSKFS